MTAKIWRIHPLAEKEIDRKAARYDRERAGLGADFVEAFAAAYAAVGEGPAVGTAERVGKHTVRRALLDRFPYAIVIVEIDDSRNRSQSLCRGTRWKAHGSPRGF